MNRTQANEWRVSQGLPPFETSMEAQAAAKRRKQAKRANAAAHAALQRTIRDNRNRNRKG